jgi:hypothetical protein
VLPLLLATLYLKQPCYLAKIAGKHSAKQTIARFFRLSIHIQQAFNIISF